MRFAHKEKRVRNSLPDTLKILQNKQAGYSAALSTFLAAGFLAGAFLAGAFSAASDFSAAAFFEALVFVAFLVSLASLVAVDLAVEVAAFVDLEVDLAGAFLAGAFSATGFDLTSAVGVGSGAETFLAKGTDTVIRLFLRISLRRLR